MLALPSESGDDQKPDGVRALNDSEPSVLYPPYQTCGPHTVKLLNLAYQAGKRNGA